MNSHLPRLLAERLAGPLPGRRAHARFEPELAYGRHAGPAPADARPAAVLLLLYPHRSAWHLPLTLRPVTLLLHAGQISLPGGVVEPGETSQAAALRELQEELGVLPQAMDVLGSLTPLWVFGSNFLVTPWLAISDARPPWRPNPSEVAELVELPLADLIDPAHHARVVQTRGGVTFTAPCILWRQQCVWGATSMILSELITLVDGANV
jgi:8-oxo-dGTP pyrophosphatase MutT (NUDIX family)